MPAALSMTYSPNPLPNWPVVSVQSSLPGLCSVNWCWTTIAQIKIPLKRVKVAAAPMRARAAIERRCESRKKPRRVVAKTPQIAERKDASARARTEK